MVNSDDLLSTAAMVNNKQTTLEFDSWGITMLVLLDKPSLYWRSGKSSAGPHTYHPLESHTRQQQRWHDRKAPTTVSPPAAQSWSPTTAPQDLHPREVTVISTGGLYQPRIRLLSECKAARWLTVFKRADLDPGSIRDSRPPLWGIH